MFDVRILVLKERLKWNGVLKTLTCGFTQIRFSLDVEVLWHKLRNLWCLQSCIKIKLCKKISKVSHKRITRLVVLFPIKNNCFLSLFLHANSI